MFRQTRTFLLDAWDRRGARAWPECFDETNPIPLRDAGDRRRATAWPECFDETNPIPLRDAGDRRGARAWLECFDETNPIPFRDAGDRRRATAWPECFDETNPIPGMPGCSEVACLRQGALVFGNGIRAAKRSHFFAGCSPGAWARMETGA